MDVVLTTVPQTALPVLAAEEETIEATAETTPEVEETTEEPVVEDEESADVGEAENPENSDVSDPAEGEQEEGTESEETPVIDEENNSDENQEQIPEDEVNDPVEEVVADPTIDGENSVMAGEDTGEPTETSYTLTLPTDENIEVSEITGAVEQKDGTYKYTPGESAADITFKVTATKGYEIAGNVTYAVAGGEGSTLTPNADGVYTIPAASITGNITIQVQAAKIQYQLRFAAFSNATVKAKVGDGALQEITAEGSVSAEYGQTVTIEVTPAENYKVRYVNTKDSAEGALDGAEAENGVYTCTYKIGENTETVTTVYVEVTKAEADIEVTFAEENGIVSVYPVTKTGDGENVKWEAADEAVETLSAKEDDKIYFIAELPADSTSKVTSVKVGNTEITPEAQTVTKTVGDKKTDVEGVLVYALDLSGVYTDVTVEIETGLNADNEQVKTIKLSTEGKGSYVLTDAEEHHSGEEILTEEDEFTFRVAGSESYYHIDKVEAVYTVGEGETAEEKTEELRKSEEETYSFDFNAKKTRAVEIKVHVSTETVTVIINNRVSDHMKYTVAEVEDKVTKKEGTSHSYIIAKDVPSFDLTVEKTDDKFKFAPIVYIGNREDGQISATDGKYVIQTAALDNDGETIINIDEEAEKKRVAVTFDENEVDVTAKVSGRELPYETEWTEAEYKEFEGVTANIYRVPTDTTLVLVVTALDNSTVKSYQIDGGTAKNLKAAGGEISVRAEKDTNVTINSESTYGETVRKEGEQKNLTAGKNGYSVDYGADYTVSLYKGNNARVVVTKVTLEGKTATEVIASTAAAQENGVAKVTVAAADANKTLTVKLFAKTGEGADAKEGEVHSFKMVVLPSATNVTITGVKNGKLAQPVDTVAEYALKTTPNTANLDNIVVEVTAVKDGATEAENNAAKVLVSAEIANGKLAVTTAPGKTATTDAAKVTLKDKTTKTAIGDSFTVDITEPALVTEKPTVKLVSSTDVALKLQLGVSKKVTTPNSGSVWYKVDVSTEDSTAGEEITQAIAKPFYIRANKDADGKLVASQTEDIVVSRKDFGEGKKCDFTVKVSLVQTTDNTDLASATDAEITAAKAFATADEKAVTISAATKDPYITTKLSLKKGTTTVYTGQRVKIATPQFDKNATYTEIDPNDIEDLTTDDQSDELIGFTVENGDIYMNVKAGQYDWVDDGNGGEEWSYVSPTLGRHDIKVTAWTTDTTVAATAKISVNVVRGIEDIRVPAPETIYKADKKAATLKLAPVLNWGSTDKNLIPKGKKLNYEISFAGSEALEAAVTVNKTNGTVTVNKNYRVSANSYDNTFCVKATAVDFVGNTVEAETRAIEVTSDKMEFGEICIADRERDDNGYRYTVPARKTDFTSKELNGKYVILLKKGVAEKSSYIYNEYDEEGESEVLDPENVTFKSGNKALTINADGKITVGKVANKVKITATANDGSKNKKDLDINIIYDQPAQLGLRVERQNNEKTGFYTLEDGSEANGGKKNVAAFTGTADTVLKFTVVQRDSDEESWSEIDQYTNFKLTVSGAKVLNKNSTYGQTQTVIANKAETKVKLQYTTKNGTTTTSTTTEYTIKNEGIKTVNAPRVRASGNLATDWGYLGMDNEGYNYLRDQAITYTVTDTAQTYSGKKWVMVTTDAADRANAKKAYSYRCLETLANNLNGYLPVNEDGTFELSFNPYRSADWDGCELKNNEIDNIPAGSYKLQCTFGTIDDEGDFVPETKTVAVTLKAVAPRKGSYKPISSVKMSLGDGASVKLSGTGKNYSDEYYSELYNANINGIENRFLHFFELDEESATLSLKPLGDNTDSSIRNRCLSASEIDYIVGTDKEAKNDRIGYVHYNAYVEGIGWVTGTTKITVTFTNGYKPLVTYKASAPTIMEGKKKAVIKMTAGKDPAQVDYAYIPDDQTFTVNGGSEYAIDGSEITVTAADALTAGNYRIDLYILPEGNYYKSELNKANEEYKTAPDAQKAAKRKTFEDNIIKYGVKTSTTVKVATKKAAGGKIQIAKADLTQAFSNNRYNGAIDMKHYDAEAPYTKTMQCQITEVVSTDKLLNGQANNPLIDFYVEPNEDDDNGTIYINMKKDKFETAVKNKKVQPGKSYNVSVTVKFGTNVWNETKKDWDRTTDKDIKEEKFTFKIKMPEKKASEELTLETAEKAVNGADVIKDYKVNSWKELYTEWDEKCDDYVIYDNLIAPALNYLEERVREIVPEDSGIRTFTPQRSYMEDDYWYYDIDLNDEDVFKAPTSQSEGYFNAVIRLANAETYNDADPVVGTYKDITFKLTIPKTMEQPSDLEGMLYEFAEKYASNNHYTNATTAADIAKDARAYCDITNSRYATLRLVVGEEYDDTPFYVEPSTDEEYGCISGHIHVFGIRYGGEDVWVPFTFQLPLLAVQDKKEKLDNLINDYLTAYSDDIKGVAGIRGAEYNPKNNTFTVSIDTAAATEDIEVVYRRWRQENPEKPEEVKAYLVEDLNEAFGDDWDNLESITVTVNASSNLLNKPRKEIRTITKQKGDTISKFADRYYDELLKQEERIIAKYEEIRDKKGLKTLTFVQFINSTADAEVTVNYLSGESVSQTFTLNVK